MTRLFYVITTYFVALAIDMSPLFHPSPKLIWNVSASAPVGLYAVQPSGPLKHGDLVITLLPTSRDLPCRAPLSAKRRALAQACRGVAG